MKTLTTSKKGIIIISGIAVLTLLTSFVIDFMNIQNEKKHYQERLQKEMLMEEIKEEFDKNKDLDG